MKNKIMGGAVAVIVGGIWAASSFQDWSMEGIRAIAIPALIALVGLNFFYKGIRGDR